jgi:hypothetical protein
MDAEPTPLDLGPTPLDLVASRLMIFDDLLHFFVKMMTAIAYMLDF